MLYVISFFLSLAVFSPLILIGARKMTGRRATCALSVNLVSYFACFVIVTVLCMVSAFAAGDSSAADAAAEAVSMGEGLKYIGAALAVGLSGIGGGIAVSGSASSALGAISENDQIFGKSLIFVGLAEGVALYGLIIAFIILFF